MWGRFTKSGLQLESVLQEPLHTEVCKTWVSAEHSLCQATLEQQTASEVSHFKKDWTAAEKRGEAHNPRCLRSSVKFPQSVMVWGAMSSAGVGPLCFLRSKVNTAVYQEVLEHFMLPAADQLYGDADFIFQQDLAPAHSAKATSTWFKDHGIPVLNWPANSPDLNLIENLWGIVKRKMRYARPKNAEELKATIRATWALITPEQCHRLIDSRPRRIAAVIQAKGAPTKY
uniref:Tc1-like transposase DDE domain-containing protein n=1 Tax=Cyprinus carpio carpio TaxID=630221 RepID=A0A9J7XU79_CYPCA